MVSTAVGIGTEKTVDVGCVVTDADETCVDVEFCEAAELWIAAKGASEFDLLTL